MKKSSTCLAKQEIAEAAKEAVSLIALQVKDAAQVIATAAANAKAITMANKEEANGTIDHDFLLTFSAEVKTRLDQLQATMAEIKDGTAKRIADLEKEKLAITESYPVLYKKTVDDSLEDKEKRIRVLEGSVTKIMTWGSVFVVLLGIAEFIISRVYR